MEQNTEQSLLVVMDAALKLAGVQVLDNTNMVRTNFYQLSSRVNELEAKLAEKDAKIKELEAKCSGEQKTE